MRNNESRDTKEHRSNGRHGRHGRHGRFPPRQFYRKARAVVSGMAAGMFVSASAQATEINEALGCDLLLDIERSTFVMREVATGRTWRCNEPRANTRLLPASSFKVAHALVLLDAGVIEDEHAPLEWDGRPRGVAAWDRNTSVAEAVAASTVWVFQELATTLGHERELAGVRRLGYGNADIGQPGDLRNFWLNGPLEISAMEQVEFLSQLRMGALNIDPEAQSRTVDMLHLGDCGDDCAVYGKTGAVLPIDDEGFLRVEGEVPIDGHERTGWFIGWIERSNANGGPVVFAHNLDLALAEAMGARTRLAYALLAANGVGLELLED